jgi:hypothetical protein
MSLRRPGVAIAVLLAAVLAALAVDPGPAVSQVAPPAQPFPSSIPAPLPPPAGIPAPLPSPATAPTATPPPAASAPAAGEPAESGGVPYFAGQLLDVQRGFVFFTTGDGYRLDPSAQTVDLATGGPTALVATTGIYARATFDPANGRIVRLALSRKRIPQGGDYERIRHFAVALSTPAPNPDLAPPSVDVSGPHGAPNGKAVLVTFSVQVPPNTPLNDSVYISTDQSRWDPMAIRMDRVDGLHYRVTRELASGTSFSYRYTRGSWLSSELGRDGLQPPPHRLFVRNVDALRRDDVVYHWTDENATGSQVNPNAIPTPYNPNPFGGLPTPPHGGIAPPLPPGVIAPTPAPAGVSGPTPPPARSSRSR